MTITPERASQMAGITIERPNGDLTEDVIRELMKPFDWHKDLEFKPGEVYTKGDRPTALALCYIEADKVIERLNRLLWGRWSMTEPKTIRDDPQRGAAVLLGMDLCGTVRYNYGEASRDDKEPLKAAHTDAIKRTARVFGMGWYFTLLSDQLWVPCALKDDGKFKCWVGLDGREWANPAEYFAKAYPLLTPDREIDEEALRAAVIFTKAGKVFTPAKNPPAVVERSKTVEKDRPQLSSNKTVPESMKKAILRQLERTGIDKGSTNVPSEFADLMTKEVDVWGNNSYDWGRKALDWLQTLPQK